jgi:hypothetical protein
MNKTSRWNGALVVAAVLLAAASARPVFAQQSLLPNLQPFPAYDLVLLPDFAGGTRLAFSTLTWNSGAGPLEVIGGEIAAPNVQNIYQRIHRDDGTFADVLAGTFVFHEEHGHIHVEDYAEYVLEREGAPGTSTRIGHKTSFCLLDTDRIDRHLPGAPKRAQFTTCNDFRQGISVGWGDAYGYNLPGQSIDVTGLETGNYLLTIVSDPIDQLLETDESDNSSTIRIHLDMEAMTVNGLPGDGPGDPPGDVTVAGIVPATMFARDVVAVTITGSGFAAGMAVSLANGSGPAPAVSDVVVHDASTITAIFSAKSGGPPRTRTWDVQVGPATLVDGFIVFP